MSIMNDPKENFVLGLLKWNGEILNFFSVILNVKSSLFSWFVKKLTSALKTQKEMESALGIAEVFSIYSLRAKRVGR